MADPENPSSETPAQGGDGMGWVTAGVFLALAAFGALGWALLAPSAPQFSETISFELMLFKLIAAILAAGLTPAAVICFAAGSLLASRARR